MKLSHEEKQELISKYRLFIADGGAKVYHLDGSTRIWTRVTDNLPESKNDPLLRKLKCIVLRHRLERGE